MLLKQFVDELGGVEGLEGVGGFAEADEAGGDAEFLLDGDDDTAFAAAVEFGDDDASDGDGFVEFAGLLEGVGAGGGVDDEEDFVRGGGVFATDDTVDLFEFLHEVVFVVEASGGVADEELSTEAFGFFVAVEADSGGVAVLRAFDEGDLEALGPDLELFDGRGAEGVGGGQDDAVALVVEEVGEFGGGGGFAGAVDADHEEDFRASVGVGKEGRDFFGELGADVVAGDLEDVFAVEFAALGAEGVDDFEGQAGADVTGDEGGFEFVPIEVGFAESGEEGFEEAGHSDCGLRNAEF